MKTIPVCLAALLLFPLSSSGQSSTITMDQEPHHHLALRNEWVKVFNVEVMPGDSIILHSHDQDTVAVAIGEQYVTVGIPGKPDVHQKNADAQVRLQRSGYIHSTHVDGNTPYHTIAVELMRPQTNFHNVCAEVLPGQPLKCPPPVEKLSSVFVGEALLESDQTYVRLVRVFPRQSVDLAKSSEFPDAPRLIIALDSASVASKSGKAADKDLRPGDFRWLDVAQGHAETFRNPGGKEARYIEVVFPHTH